MPVYVGISEDLGRSLLRHLSAARLPLPFSNRIISASQLLNSSSTSVV